MFPSIGIFSMLLSLLLGAVIGWLAVRLLNRINIWFDLIVSLLLLLLTPFVGHSTWLFASTKPDQGEMSGVHLQYLLLTFSLVVAVTTLVRLITQGKVQTRTI